MAYYRIRTLNSAAWIVGNSIDVICSSSLSCRAVMLHCPRMLGAWSAGLDLLTTAAIIIGGLLLIVSILATIVTLTFALPYGGGPTDLVGQLGLDSTVIVRLLSSMAAN